MLDLMLFKYSTAAYHASIRVILGILFLGKASIVLLLDLKGWDETTLLLAVQVEDGKDVIEGELAFTRLGLSLFPR